MKMRLYTWTFVWRVNQLVASRRRDLSCACYTVLVADTPQHQLWSAQHDGDHRYLHLHLHHCRGQCLPHTSVMESVFYSTWSSKGLFTFAQILNRMTHIYIALDHCKKGASHISRGNQPIMLSSLVEEDWMCSPHVLLLCHCVCWRTPRECSITYLLLYNSISKQLWPLWTIKQNINFNCMYVFMCFCHSIVSHIIQ